MGYFNRKTVELIWAAAKKKAGTRRYLFALPLLFCCFLVFGGSVALKLPTSADAQPYPTQASPLENEVPLFVAEFASIIAQYRKIPPGAAATKNRVEIMRRLLDRLNRMKPQTAFLEGQKTILSASLRLWLRIGGAEASLYKLAVESTEPSVRDDAVLTLINQALRANDRKMLENIYNETQSGLSYPLKSFLAVLLRRKDHVTSEEAAYLVNYYLENMVEEFQDSTTLSRLIDDLAEKVNIEDIDRITDKFLAGNQPAKALPFVRFRLEKEEMSFEDLLSMGLRFGTSESSFVIAVRQVKERTEAMKKYLSLYDERIKARSRGRSFNITLNRYRGTKKHPYNLAMTEKSFSDYLSGDVEDRYISDNTEKAVRNYLASRRFDLIEEHLTLAKEKIWEGFYSPYINFWLAYSRIQLGKTEGISEMLTEVISESPETYFGLMAVELLNHMFKTEPAGSALRRNLFSRLKLEMGNSENNDKRVSAAIVMYYLGGRMERSQAESLLSSQGMIDNSSRKGFSKEGALLTEAYLALGLQNAARRILYRENISHPFEQDIIFSSLYEESESETGFIPTFSRKRSALVGGMSRIIGSQALKAYYPRPFAKQVASALGHAEHTIDENLVYAIIRQESFYRTNARSHAGARGLMQLMPATARQVALSVKMKTYNLYDPEVNILLGTTYLSDNVKRLGLIPALAAYNGGPNRVLEVQAKYTPQNTFEFIEVHPIKETRNYMKKVLEHYNRYSVIYKGEYLDFSQTGGSLF